MSIVNSLKINHKNVFHLNQSFLFDNIQAIDNFEKTNFETCVSDIILYKKSRAIVMLTQTLKNMK